MKLNYLKSRYNRLIKIIRDEDQKDLRYEAFSIFQEIGYYFLANEMSFHHVTAETVSFDYALDYLDKFLINHVDQKREFLSFRSFKNHVRKDLKNYVKDHNFFEEYEVLCDIDRYFQGELIDSSREQVIHEIVSLLKVFYTQEKISQYLPLLLSLLKKRRYTRIIKGNSSDFKYFSLLTLSLCKKISHYWNVEFGDDGLNDVSMMVLNLLEHDFSDELFMALDTQSLRRLSLIAGGNTVYIPEIREIEDLFSKVKETVKFKYVNSKSAPYQGDSKGIQESSITLCIDYLEKNKGALSESDIDKLKKMSANTK